MHCSQHKGQEPDPVHSDPGVVAYFVQFAIDALENPAQVQPGLLPGRQASQVIDPSVRHATASALFGTTANMTAATAIKTKAPGENPRDLVQ